MDGKLGEYLTNPFGMFFGKLPHINEKKIKCLNLCVQFIIY